MCNFDLNKSQMNIIESFTARASFTFNLLTAACAQRQRGVVNKPVKLSLIQADI